MALLYNTKTVPRRVPNNPHVYTKGTPFFRHRVESYAVVVFFALLLLSSIYPIYSGAFKSEQMSAA